MRSHFLIRKSIVNGSDETRTASTKMKITIRGTQPGFASNDRLVAVRSRSGGVHERSDTARILGNGGGGRDSRRRARGGPGNHRWFEPGQERAGNGVSARPARGRIG